MDSGHAGAGPHDAYVGIVHGDRLPVPVALGVEVAAERRSASMPPLHGALTMARPLWPAGQTGPRTRSNTVVRHVTELATSFALAASVSRASWLA